MRSKDLVGQAGELYIAQQLSKDGYLIVRKNYRTKFGEVDIIASKGKTLYLVEVKSRLGDNAGFPEDMVNRKKLLHMARCASYIQNFFDHEGPVEVLVAAVHFERIEPLIVKRVTFYPGCDF